MKRQSERRIPYRVCKKVFQGCESHDYDNGTIVVKFPQEYISDKVIAPDGWDMGGNYVESPEDERHVYIHIAWFSDGGVRYYDAYVMQYNQFGPMGRRKSKQYISSFAAALDWAQLTAGTM